MLGESDVNTFGSVKRMVITDASRGLIYVLYQCRRGFNVINTTYKYNQTLQDLS